MLVLIMKKVEILKSYSSELLAQSKLLIDMDLQKIFNLATDIKDIFLRGNRVYFFGNGGSASEAGHLATEFVSKCRFNHEPLPSISLSDSISNLTAIANDYGFENVFSRQVQAFVKKGDLVIGLSTSGTSRNVVNGLSESVNCGARAILWTGNLKNNIEGVEIWESNAVATSRIQEIHLTWGHILVEFVELLLVEKK